MKLRSISFAVATLALAASANALTLDWTKLQGTSKLAFSDDAIALFKANGGKLAALGNTTATDSTGWNFTLPITSITVSSSLKIASGQASGSAIDIVRKTVDDDGNIVTSGVVLANFTLDYNNKQVLADTTPHGGTTQKQLAVYSFVTANALALKYVFPLTITGHEVLNTLKLTPTSLAVIAPALGITGDSVLALAAGTDFGSLTQDIATVARKPAVSATPFVPTN